MLLSLSRWVTPSIRPPRLMQLPHRGQDVSQPETSSGVSHEGNPWEIRGGNRSTWVSDDLRKKEVESPWEWMDPSLFCLLGDPSMSYLYKTTEFAMAGGHTQDCGSQRKWKARSHENSGRLDWTCSVQSFWNLFTGAFNSWHWYDISVNWEHPPISGWKITGNETTNYIVIFLSLSLSPSLSLAPLRTFENKLTHNQ